jgi:hypothetical protein
MTTFDRRLIGAINQFNVSGSENAVSGGGGGSLTITNNQDGYILKATGEADRIEGIPSFVSSSTGISASLGMYITGSDNYLYLHGLDANGVATQFKVSIEGGIFKVLDFNK